MSASPYAQRPITYHLVTWPWSVVARMRTSIHVRAGVAAFHDATSSVYPNPVENHGETNVAPGVFANVTPPFGSGNAWELTLYGCAARPGPATSSVNSATRRKRRPTGRSYDPGL